MITFTFQNDYVEIKDGDKLITKGNRDQHFVVSTQAQRELVSRGYGKLEVVKGGVKSIAYERTN